MFNIKNCSLITSVFVMSFLVGYSVLSWTGPTGTAPASNVSAPINVSSTAQTKSGSLTIPILYDSDNNIYYINSASTGTAALFAGSVGIGTTSPGAKLDVNGTAYVPQLFINRSGGAGRGISWYAPSYTAWSEYMCPAGTSGCGPTANITTPSGTLVTSWGIHNFIENAAGYGWTWESGSAAGQPSVVAEIRSSDGTFRTAGSIYMGNPYIYIPATNRHLWLVDSDGTARFALRTSDGYGHGMSWVSGWKDLAENMLPGKEVKLEAGDIVKIDERSRNRVVKTDSAYCPTTIGAISTKPGLLMNQDVEEKYNRGYPVSLAGRVPTKVTDINGSITIGDPITTSSIPGIGMKATKSGRIVGYAMEAFPYNEPTGDGNIDAIDGTPYRGEFRVTLDGEPTNSEQGYLVGKISMFVNPSQYESNSQTISGSVVLRGQEGNCYKLSVNKDGQVVTTKLSETKCR
ncbi:MAG: hypothetical protein PHF44_03785 [Candidatus Pacebacteria bacterium]|nr:hypothetical protein [Candidatus Paceibacterota bacterium]